ncbi:protein MMS22-like isoform X2 [Bacillus rossius redtenbacheri]|uniref:protein MMS22-like isoform X2 n=1 Tax=Bacillus rossius redtenbacheri TaxID=93214 RepID=UPI002FDD9D0B
MTEDCTPPSSPYRCSPRTPDISNYGFYRPFDCFSNRSSDKNLDIHDELCLKKEHYLEPVTCVKDGIGFVSDLFLYKCLDDLATWSPIEELFRVCRMKLMTTGSWEEPQLDVRRRLLNELMDLRGSVDRAAADGLARETEESIAEYFDQLCSLRLLLGYLPDIPDCVLSHVSAQSASAFPEAWYSLFHLHLDLRWFHLTCVYQLARLGGDRPVLPSRRQLDESFFERQLALLASELLELAVRRFEKTALHDLPHTPPYSCRCVEEMWLMLQLLVETAQLCLSVQPFESLVKVLLDSVQQRRGDRVTVSRNCSEVTAPDAFHCSNPTGFCLWFLFHLSQLGGYSVEGLYLGPSCARVRSNYEQLSSILRRCLGAEPPVAEEQLRAYLALVGPLVTEWWELSTEPVLLLWEYFHCRLDSAFYVRGATPHSIAVVSPSGSALLGQVRSLLDAPPPGANSFSLFLSLLGALVRRGAREGDRRAWQQLKGRIFSRLSPARTAGLSELGLYHLASLFLALAVAFPAEQEQVVGRCQTLLGGLLNGELDTGRRAVIWKANIAFILLHVESGIGVSEVARNFLSEVGLNTGNSPLMKMFIGDLLPILGSHCDASGGVSHLVLFDGWLVPYLSGAAPGDAQPLLEAVLRAVKRGGEAGARLGGLVLQHVKRQFAARGGAQPVAVRLAAELTSLAAGTPDSYAELFRYFGCSPVVDAGAGLRYLCLLLQGPGATETLARHVLGHALLLVQAWVRFQLVCPCLEEVAPLTRVVASLPEVAGLCSAAGGARLEMADDAFLAFVEALGRAYADAPSDEQARAALRRRCASYLGQVAQYADPVLREPPSYHAVLRVYACALQVVRHCKSLLYQKNSPSNVLPSLVAHLFLPQQQPEGRDLPAHRLAAIGRHLAPLLRELLPLARGSDSVSRLVRQLVARYLPAFGGPLAPAGHPLLELFSVEGGGPGDEGGGLLLRAVSDEMLRGRGATLHKDADTALAYVLRLTERHGGDATVLQLVAETCLRRVLETAMFSSEACRHQGRAACAAASAFLASPALDASEPLRESCCGVLLKLCEDHLAFSMVPLFKLLSLVTTFRPRLVERALPRLWAEVRRVESRRGVARDPALRAAMSKIEDAVNLKIGQQALL